MKICAIVVTYYPKVSGLISNIHKYIDNVDHLIIWENTPQQDRAEYFINIPKHSDKISYMSGKENLGIAFPLNRAAKWAKDMGYTHIMTMDQDSSWENFEFYRHNIEGISDPNVAIFYPTIVSKNLTGRALDIPITSGSVIPINILNNLGGFKDNYFIDCVDTEFFYRAISRSFRTALISEAKLYHSLGYAEQHKILGMSFYTDNYPPTRLYHMIRNNLWMYREYRNRKVLPSCFLIELITDNLFKRIFKIILGEKDKISKIAALFRGTYHGICVNIKTFSNSYYAQL